MKNTQRSLIKVLENFAFDTQDASDRQTVLEKYVNEFPQFADELKSFAVENDLLEFSHLEPISDAEMQNHLRASRKTLNKFLASKESKVAEIKSLYAVGEQIGLKKKDIKQRLGISTSLLVYLEKRRLEFQSIPPKLIKRIADLLKQTENSISQYLNQASDFAGEANFKTNSRPEADNRTKTFAEAIREDQELTKEQKQELLNLAE